MEYYVRQVVDVRTGDEFWALLDKRCMDDWCEEGDVKAVAGSRPELELKMTAMGLRLGGAARTCRLFSSEAWTTWSVSGEGERTDG